MIILSLIFISPLISSIPPLSPAQYHSLVTFESISHSVAKKRHILSCVVSLQGFMISYCRCISNTLHSLTSISKLVQHLWVEQSHYCFIISFLLFLPETFLSFWCSCKSFFTYLLMGTYICLVTTPSDAQLFVISCRPLLHLSCSCKCSAISQFLCTFNSILMITPKNTHSCMWHWLMFDRVKGIHQRR